MYEMAGRRSQGGLIGFGFLWRPAALVLFPHGGNLAVVIGPALRRGLAALLP